MNFNAQSLWYTRYLQTRNREPVKPATVALYQSLLTNHVLPALGDKELQDFGNGAMKDFAAVLIAKKLAPKTIKEICLLVRSIVASAVDSEGNQFYPRTWNEKFLDLPPVKHQRQPYLKPEALQAILDNEMFCVRDRVFVGLLAASGLRLGEVQSLRIGPEQANQSTWNSVNQALYIKRSIWRGHEQEPKTPAAVRCVSLFPAVNEMLKEFTTGRSVGEFIFATRTGRPLPERYVRYYILRPMRIKGAHVLRRFRISHLRNTACPEDIIKGWVGHELGGDITAKYSKLFADETKRKKWAVEVGIGIKLPCGTPSAAKLIPKPMFESEQKPKRKHHKKRKSLAKRIKAAEKDLSASTYTATLEDLPSELLTPALTVGVLGEHQ